MKWIQVRYRQSFYYSDVILSIFFVGSHINTMFNTNPSCFSDLSNKVCKGQTHKAFMSYEY